jgi:hypothetical protein
MGQFVLNWQIFEVDCSCEPGGIQLKVLPIFGIKLFSSVILANCYLRSGFVVIPD